MENEKELNNRIGNRLRDILKEKKISNVELAKLIYCTPQQISYIIHGKRKLTFENAHTIGELLDLNPDYLLCKTDYKTREDFEDLIAGKQFENYTLMQEIISNICIKIEDAPPQGKTEKNEEEIENYILNYLHGSKKYALNYMKNPNIDFIQDTKDTVISKYITYQGTKYEVDNASYTNLIKDILEYAEYKLTRILTNPVK